ncbi:MAG: hypothetical protein WC136_00820 [Sphaerochaeta sp.]
MEYIIVIIVLIILTMIDIVLRLRGLRGLPKINPPIEKVDIMTLHSTYDFLNKILLDKFEFYLSGQILPYLINGKSLDNKMLHELKEQYYIDVTKMLNKDMQDRILEVFSKQGIILYIHQSFLKAYNAAEIKYKSDSYNTRSLESFYKQ